MVLNNQKEKNDTAKTIQQTIISSILQDGFWDRWIAHGIEKELIQENRTKLSNLDGWIEVFENRAKYHSDTAETYCLKHDFTEAEQHYRLSGLYYNIIQWVFPKPMISKLSWYNQCLLMFEDADKISTDSIMKYTLQINKEEYFGRVRKPKSTILGIIIIVNPIDSTKEELFTYEDDFAKAGFVVISFDGPGQGETLLFNMHKADQSSWASFLDGVIEFASDEFSGLPIHLFGTSSGGTWAIEGGKHPLVAKIISVSPAPKPDIKMPDYFKTRLSNMLEDFNKGFLPNLKDLQKVNNILVFHGKQDVMVDEKDLLDLFFQLSSEKRFITYENEGHCCNFKLPELRQRTIRWLKGENINAI